MTECNAELSPVFKEISQKAIAQRALGENGQEYKGKSGAIHSDEWLELDSELESLYLQAIHITKHYYFFNKLCEKDDCRYFNSNTKKRANHCQILQCADFGDCECPFYRGGKP